MRWKLDDNIRAVDSVNKSLMETEARKDIEAYKNRQARANGAIA